MAFNYNAAKQAGFTDEQIGAYMRMKGVTAPQKKSVGGFMGNIVKSGIQAGVDLGGAVVNTVNPDKNKNTLVNMNRLAQGVGQMLDPTKGNKIANASNKATSYIMPFMAPMLNPDNVNYEDYAKNVGKFYKDRYGGVEKITNTLYNDPVGVGLDVASLASGAGAGLKASGLAKAGNAFSKAAKFTDPFSMAGKGAKLVAKGSTSKLGKFGRSLEKFGDDYVLQGRGNPKLTRKVISQIKSTGDTPLEYFQKNPVLFSRDSGSVGALASDLGQQYGSSVRAIPKDAIRVVDLLKSYDDAISRLQKQVLNSADDVAASHLKTLQSRREAVASSLGKTEYVNPEQLHQIAMAVDKRIPQAKWMQDQAEIAGQPIGAYMRERDILRGSMRQNSPGLRELGKNESILKNIEKLYGDAENRSSARQPINFTKLGGATVGAVTKGIPGAIGGFVAEELIRSPIGTSAISKGSSLLGKAIQGKNIPKIRVPGKIKTISSYAPATYGYAQAGRVLTPTSASSQNIPSANTRTQQRKAPVEVSPRIPQSSYSPMPKLPPVKTPKPSKDAQAFSGNFKLKRGSFY